MTTILFGRMSLKRLASCTLDLFYYLVAKPNDLNDHRVRALLRKFPWWSGGHLRLFDVQLARKDCYSAGISAHAVRILRGENDWHYRYAQGRLLLAVGDLKQAAHLLEAVVTQRPQQINAREDYAAALIALNQGQEAYEILCAIPERKRSGMVRDMIAANRR
jgi:predicted Zn-dependent protease